MTVDMTNNRVPYGLLTDEEKAALHEHEKAGGKFEYWTGAMWYEAQPHPTFGCVYRTVPLPAQRSEQSSLKTQDVIAWEKLPDWVEWVARDERGFMIAFSVEPSAEPEYGLHSAGGSKDYRRIDDFPGIVVQVGTCDWKDSKQRRPQVRK